MENNELTRTEKIANALAKVISFPEDVLNELGKLNDEQFENFKKLKLKSSFSNSLLNRSYCTWLGVRAYIIAFIFIFPFIPLLIGHIYIYRARNNNLKIVTNWLKGLEANPTGYLETASESYGYQTIGELINSFMLKLEFMQKLKSIQKFEQNKKAIMFTFGCVFHNEFTNNSHYEYLRALNLKHAIEYVTEILKRDFLDTSLYSIYYLECYDKFTKGEQIGGIENALVNSNISLPEDTWQKLAKLNDIQFENFKKLKLKPGLSYEDLTDKSIEKRIIENEGNNGCLGCFTNAVWIYFNLLFLLIPYMLRKSKRKKEIEIMKVSLIEEREKIIKDNLKIINDWLEGLKTNQAKIEKTVSIQPYYKTIEEFINDFRNKVREENNVFPIQQTLKELGLYKEENDSYKQIGSYNIGSQSLEELLNELKNLTGLKKLKMEVETLINQIKIKKIREEKGLEQISMSHHLVFMGNPGTGKTTVARILAGIYRNLGILSKGQLIETDRSGLVAGYTGQTALKTQEIANNAKGGILFIDEAYSLYSENENNDPFGKEAIDTLLKIMEDNRDDFIVIVAGYPDLMKKFLKSNPGLESRFNNFIDFEDYEGSELYEIFTGICKKNKYVLENAAVEPLKQYFANLYQNRGDNYANARDVRNFFEKALKRQANRLTSNSDLTDSDLITITKEDLFENISGKS